MPRIEILSIPISSLNILKNNPRKISKEQFQKLCASLKKDPEFFKNRPCLVNKTDKGLEVYAGNQRIQAAKKLGWKEVPVIIEEGLSEEINKDRIINDNKHYGEFDFYMLANEWEIDTLIDAGF